MSEPDSFLERRRRERRTGGAAVPPDFADLSRAAREALPEAAYEYVAAGAGGDGTVRANRRGFDDWRIRPRVLRDVADRTLGVELFGRSLPAPLALAPVGGLTRFGPEGELAAAGAAASLGIPFALSTAATHSIEAVAEAAPDAPRWFQLYWLEDRAATASLAARAEDAGYDAILLTADYQVPRWMPGDVGETLPIQGGTRLANLATDPVAADPDDESTTGRDASVTWTDLEVLRERTDLPVVVKGVVHPEDARLAVEHGADGVVVSNHGGRQIDGAVGAVTALPGVVDAVDGRLPVLFDGGVRGGADAFKALALGADAVSLGRPYVYGLAVAGERGVYEVAHDVLAELESVLGLAGYDDVRDVDRTALVDASTPRSGRDDARPDAD